MVRLPDRLSFTHARGCLINISDACTPSVYSDVPTKEYLLFLNEEEKARNSK